MTPQEPGPASGRIGPYRIERRLGAGGMGVVFLGYDDTAGAAAAVKVIRPEYAADEQFRARLRREVTAARQVPRFCTAPVLGADLDADVPWVATEYIDAPTLDVAVMQHGPLHGLALEAFAAGVAGALRAIHDHGVIHRDLKPSNVLVPPAGPRVIDFGIARLEGAHTQVTHTGVTVGTPAYMAPEQLAGDPLTTAVDVFAWAGLVIYAATGRPPFGVGDGVVHAIRHEQPDLGGMTGSLREPVGAAFAKDPTARPSASDLVDQLSRTASTATTQVLASATTAPDTAAPEPAGAREPAGRRHLRRRRGLLAATASVLVLLALLGGGVRWAALESGYHIGVTSDGEIAVFRGVPMRVAGISLYSFHSGSGVHIDELTPAGQQAVRDNPGADTAEEAEAAMHELVDANGPAEPRPSPPATPQPTPT